MPSSASPANTSTRSPRIRLDPEVYERLRELHDQGYSGAAIYNELERAFGERAPQHINTVYNHVRRLGRDRSDAWTLADRSFEAAAARAVLDELRGVDQSSEGRITHFTTREAAWIARLRGVWPEMEADGTAYLWAREYIRAEDAGPEQVGALDLRLRLRGGDSLPVGRTRRRGSGPVVKAEEGKR